MAAQVVNKVVCRDTAPILVDEVDDAQAELGEIIEAEVEEASERRVLPTPEMPCQSDIDKHREDHLPYASWCDHCVEGRGREMGHHAIDKVKHTVPTISFDYLFMNNKGEFVKKKSESDTVPSDGINILVVKDSRSKAVFAHIVPSKGVDDKKYAVIVLMDDVKWMGYTRLTLKSDNEPAITRLLTESLKGIRVATEPEVAQVMEEHPPPFDSQANGDIESAVKQIRGQTRTLQSCLEARIGHQIPVVHPVYSWLVSHAAWLVTTRVMGHDGKTAYQRVRGKPFNNRLLGIGEKCRFKLRSKESPDKFVDGNRFHQGIFVGFSRIDGQYLLYHNDSIREARTVMRLPNILKWNSEEIQKVNVTPYGLHQAPAPHVIFKRGDPVVEAARADQQVIARQVYIRTSDLEAFGYTDGCPKCQHELQYGPNRTGRPHSVECRQRIMEKLRDTEHGRFRLRRATERLDRSVAEMGERLMAQGEIEAAPVVAPQMDHQPLLIPFENLHNEEATPPEAFGRYAQISNQPLAGDSEPPAMTEEDDFYIYGGAAQSGGFDRAQDGDMEVSAVEAKPVSMLGERRRTRIRASTEVSPPGADDGRRGGSGEIDRRQAPGDPLEPKRAVESEDGLGELHNILTKDFISQLSDINAEIMSVIDAMGGDKHSYIRERKKSLKHMVAEIYSPPRVTAATNLLPELRCIPGFALDLTTCDSEGRPWDFNDLETRKRARALYRVAKPMLLVGSQMCTAYSAWQHINNTKRDPAIVKQELARA